MCHLAAAIALGLVVASFKVTSVLGATSGAPSVAPLLQLAGELPRSHAGDFGQDSDSDEVPAPGSHHSAVPGGRAATNVTASPNGYDAKHLNRLWGRFRGAKPNTKVEKRHK